MLWFSLSSKISGWRLPTPLFPLHLTWEPASTRILFFSTFSLCLTSFSLGNLPLLPPVFFPEGMSSDESLWAWGLSPFLPALSWLIIKRCWCSVCCFYCWIVQCSHFICTFLWHGFQWYLLAYHKEALLLILLFLFLSWKTVIVFLLNCDSI